MTTVNPRWFGVDTPEEAWAIANQMAVTPEFFAELSCEGDRVFGLVTRCKRDNCQDSCETVLNECARKTLWQYLYLVQQEMEALLHWTLTPRYVTERLPWREGEPLQLSFGGVSMLNVTSVPVSLGTDFPINHYVETHTLGAPAAGVFTVDVRVDHINDPLGVQFVDAVTKGSIDPQYIKIVGKVILIGVEYWRFTFSAAQASIGDTLYVFDCRWGYVDVNVPCVAPTVGPVGERNIVYEDTMQIVPVEKVISDYPIADTDRHFILHRNVIMDVFVSDEIDLDNDHEVWKLMDRVDVACFEEHCQPPTIYRKCGVNQTFGYFEGCDSCDDDSCEITEHDACATIRNRKLGIIDLSEVVLLLDDVDDPILDPDTGCPTYRQLRECDRVDHGVAYEIEVSYFTSPHESDRDKTNAVEGLRQALAARVAAEVVLVDCGCNVECGYFKEMRMELGVVTKRPTSTTITVRYGDKVGQQKYHAALVIAPRDGPVGKV